MDNAQPVLMVLSAPSGAGKTTVCQQLLAHAPGLTRAITCTTRAPRAGETNGVDYYFLAPEEFQTRIQGGAFLEHATVYRNHYGTLKSEVRDRLRQGRDVLLTVDVQGVASLRAAAEADPELRRALFTVFLTPPSIPVLEARLRQRGTDTEAVIRQRLGEARQELAQWSRFDYLLISTTVTEDFRRAQAILDAEKMRTARWPALEF